MTTGTSSPAFSEATADRYGSSKNRNFGGRILVIALAALLLGAVAYTVVQFTNATSSTVSAKETGGSVVSDDRLNMRVDVTRKDPSLPAYCIVTAMDYDKNEVGRREFYVPPHDLETTRHSVDINTRVKAYSGKVYGCSTTIPEYLQTDNS